MYKRSRITKPAIICVCCVSPLNHLSGVYLRCPAVDSRVPINLLACQFPTLSLRRHFRKAAHTAYSFSRPPSSMTSITHRTVMHLHALTTSGLTPELRQHARKKESPTQFPLRYCNNMLPVTIPPTPQNITLRTS